MPWRGVSSAIPYTVDENGAFTEQAPGFTGKRVLREAFADLLPDWIARDTKKKTFTLPLMKWMRANGVQVRLYIFPLKQESSKKTHLRTNCTLAHKITVRATTEHMLSFMR